MWEAELGLMGGLLGSGLHTGGLGPCHTLRREETAEHRRQDSPVLKPGAGHSPGSASHKLPGSAK